MSVGAVVVWFSLIAGQTAIGDATPAPITPPPLAAPGDDKGDGKGDGNSDGDAPTPGAPVPDGVEAEEDWPMVSTVSGAGCVAGGLFPGVGALAGVALAFGGTAASCGPLALVSGISGLVLGVPSLLLLAPCAVGGAACGAAVGAVIDDEDPATAAAWTIPGLVVGTLGGGLAAVGLFVAQNSDRPTFAAGTTMVVAGSLLALIGGPMAVAGATLTRTPALPGADDAEDKALDKGNAVDVALPEVNRSRTVGTALPMVF